MKDDGGTYYYPAPTLCNMLQHLQVRHKSVMSGNINRIWKTFKIPVLWCLCRLNPNNPSLLKPSSGVESNVYITKT